MICHYLSESWIVCDLDGTLCNDAHRLPLQTEDWEAYNSGLIADDPVSWVKTLLLCESQQGRGILLLSARPQRYLTRTLSWLEMNFSEPKGGDCVVVLRPDNSPGVSADWKATALKDFINGDFPWAKERKILYALENDARVVSAFNKEFCWPTITVPPCEVGLYSPSVLAAVE